MSVILEFNICESSDCTSFIFTDTTGQYNALTNEWGWGAPNDTLGDVITPCTLDITTPGGTTYSVDLVTTSPVFPVDQAPNELTLDMSSLGGTAGNSIPDGIYTFVYTVTTSVLGVITTYTQTVTAAFYCQVNCCVFSMFKDLDPDCTCCDEDRNTLINAYLMLKGLIYNANCGDVDQFNTTLAALQKICLNNNCQNCR